jgi:hypothetical protein
MQIRLTVIALLGYLPLWLLVGIAVEMRIFVPFLLLLTPVAAKVLVLQLSPVGALADDSSLPA